MTNAQDRLTNREMLALYPPEFVIDLVEDDTFRAALGIKDGLLVVVGDGERRFPRRRFYAAIRSLYASNREVVLLADQDARQWSMARSERKGVPALKIESNGEEDSLYPHLILHPDPAVRLREFDGFIKSAGLWPNALAEWRALVELRIPDDDEIRHLQSAFEESPGALAKRVHRELRGPTGSSESIAPLNRDYYDLLTGPGAATDVEALKRDVVDPQVSRLLTIPGEEGARMALLLSAHPTLLANGALAVLPETELVDLLSWTSISGDLLSRTAAIEIGLAALPRCGSLEPHLVELVESVRDADPDDRDGRLVLLSGLLAYVGKEISRTRLLEDLLPFQRRFIIFAQASYFERLAFGQLDPGHLGEWGHSHGLRRFYFQTLIDLRDEPRWTAEFIASEQLKAELIGRITNASHTHAANIPAGKLHDLLFGDDNDGIRKHVQFPQSFLPGPLEGPADGANNPLPDEFKSMVAEALAAPELKPQSLIALINLRSLFSIEGSLVDRAIELIKAAGHRFDLSVDQSSRQQLFHGLAHLAAVTRNSALAEELRMMIRKNRVDDPSPPSLGDELMIAIVAAASNQEFGAWSRAIGDWGTELAFRTDHHEADRLHSDLELLCLIEPRLRANLGSALAALEAVLATAS